MGFIMTFPYTSWCKFKLPTVFCPPCPSTRLLSPQGVPLLRKYLLMMLTNGPEPKRSPHGKWGGTVTDTQPSTLGLCVFSGTAGLGTESTGVRGLSRACALADGLYPGKQPLDDSVLE